MDRTIIRGDSYEIPIKVKDEQGQPLDITGATVWLTVSKSSNPKDDDNALIQKSTTSHSNPTQGESSITLTDSDTTQTLGRYWYDTQVVDTLGNVTSSPKARFIINSDITRSK